MIEVYAHMSTLSRRDAMRLCLGGAASLALCGLADLLGWGGLRQALAASRAPRDGESRNARDVPGSNNMFEIQVDGSWQVAYCMDTLWGDPANNSPYVCAGWATGALGYIAAHGWAGTMQDSGMTRLATNCAVWVLMSDGTGSVRSVDEIADGLGVDEGTAQLAHSLLSSAVAFHRSSRNTSSARENHAGTVWIPKNLPSGWPYANPVSDRHVDSASSAWTQRVLVPTEGVTYGSLVVRKVVDGADGGGSFSFRVSFGGAGAPDAQTFTLRGGQSKTISDIPSGCTYEVSEASSNHYETTWANRTGTIGENTTVTVTCTNHMSGWIQVSKDLSI